VLLVHSVFPARIFHGGSCVRVAETLAFVRQLEVAVVQWREHLSRKLAKRELLFKHVVSHARTSTSKASRELHHEHDRIMALIGIEETVAHTVGQAAIDRAVASATLVVVRDLRCHIQGIADAELDTLLQRE